MSQEGIERPSDSFDSLLTRCEGASIQFRARAHHSRLVGSQIMFLVLRQGISTIQVVLTEEEGKVSHNMVEDAGRSLAELTRPDTHYPRIGQTTRLANQVVDLRPPVSHSIFHVCAGITNHFRTFLDSQGFTEIQSPKLQPAATESGSEWTTTRGPLEKNSDLWATSRRRSSIKVKIRGLGVMSSLMGKSMTDVDMIWVVPKVKVIEYPPGEPIEPIEVIIFGEPYLKVISSSRTRTRLVWTICRLRSSTRLGNAGHDAWRESDGDTRGMLPIQHNDNWDPVHQDEPARPSWGDHESAMDSPGLRSGNTSRDDLAVSQPLLAKPPPGRNLIASDITLNADYHNSVASQTQYNTFLERANRQFARGNQDAPDPFLDHSRASLSTRPYKAEREASIDPETMTDYLNGFKWGCPPHGGGVGLEHVVVLVLKLGDVRWASLIPRDPRGFPQKDQSPPGTTQQACRQ
ncbi:hypothetical protein BJ322DRAFT_1167861 [Thelephora terrestris]|uniref:Aminoacyl-tRNA synthetase class II (D/K/N) domain-containing protein n=1 Tax=Thelephora terrestris TaxID=56493 RepID=A0A9P6H804_9AGAM|nr:hypothetical protein BJ322DRAFT_1167861 [Thelephora terrestris]